MAELVKLGRIVNGYSNYLWAIAIDEKYAAAWRGTGDDDGDEEESDFDRAGTALQRRRYELAIGKGKGIAFDVGGCGSSDVQRVGNALVMVEHFTGDDHADAEAALERAIATTPTRKPEKLGTVAVASGLLLLMDPLEAGARAKARDLAAVKKRGASPTASGLLIGVKPGRYDIWRDSLGRIEGDWGIIDGRVRIVPAGTKVVAGKPIAEMAPAPKTREAAVGERRLAPRWKAVHSMSIAEDGRAFAGQSGGYRVCAWAGDGKLAWQREVKQRGKGSAHEYTLGVQLVRDVVLAHPAYGDAICALDAATGKLLDTIAIPKARTMKVSPDCEHLLLRVDTGTVVLAYPTLERLAELKGYCNRNQIAISNDSRWVAVHGLAVHVYDLRTFAQASSFQRTPEPTALAFAADGRLLVGYHNGRLEAVDPKTGKKLAGVDAAKDRKSKPPITAIAASATHIAVGREDGTVVLYDAALRLLRAFEKHDVTIPGTGATTLRGVALVGQRLWVTAGPKQGPVGLSAYAI